MRNRKTAACLSLGALVCLAACTLSPKYSRPKPPVPSAWQTAATQPETGAPLPRELKWQEFFGDEGLRHIIQTALDNNRDLRVAAFNVERVQAQYRIQRAPQYPTVNGGVSSDLYRLPKDLSGTRRPYGFQEHNVNVGMAAWELDLFGRVRSLKAAALEQYLASEQARSAAQISLVAAVATSYLTMAADEDSLRLARETLESQQASYDLVRRIRDLGIGNDLEVRDAQSQVEAAQVEIARFTGQIAVDRDSLDLLAGTPVPPGFLPGRLGSDGVLKDISAGLNSDVLLGRPDILSAEHQLKAAYADIGAARAAYFPRITLTGGGGLMSARLSNLFTSDARTWSFTPQISQPIFDAGVRKANVRIAQVNRDSAIAEYEKAIQTAFREVSDSLSLRTWLMEQQNAQAALVNTLEETYHLSQTRYQAGIDNYLTVLVAQRSMYAGQQGLLNVRLARLGNLVTLYKVLGGGA